MANFRDALAMLWRLCRSIARLRIQLARPRSTIPAFVPVTKDEAHSAPVSLSVLSRLVPILPEALKWDAMACFISAARCRGLLLPQVPVEHGWDRDTFLDQTCRKAGLPVDAWRQEPRSRLLPREVFDDGEIGVQAFPLNPHREQFSSNFECISLRILLFSNLSYLLEKLGWALAVRLLGQSREGNMELAIVIVVVVVAGAMIPGNPGVRFFR